MPVRSALCWLRLSVLALAAALLVACPVSSGDDDDDDFTLDDDDTSPTGDCGSETCADDQFCRDETCEDIWGRSFRFTIHSAVIDETGPTGEAWDPYGGLPDSYAEITWNGDVVVDTEKVDDTLSPSWGDSDTQVLTSGGELCFSIYDYDWPDADDTIDSGCWEGDDAVVAWVRLGSYDPELYGGFASLLVSIEPNF